jgi:hypothetical protein
VGHWESEEVIRVVICRDGDLRTGSSNSAIRSAIAEDQERRTSRGNQESVNGRINVGRI